MAKATVLCVDDDRASLECRSFLLNALGYEVLTAGNGPEALSIFGKGAVDLVIVDYAMPEMNGGVLAARLKEIAPQIPVLMISGQDHVPSNALQCVDQFMAKAEGPATFLAGVQDLLAGASPLAHVLRAGKTHSLPTYSVKEP
ncbi:MAG TPA: response regulator [Terriglobales bacterium]|nr:response regulator [Terriglobales bacterium]